MAPDVSIVLALHREGNFLSRTLLSLAEAAHYARGFGIRTELVAVLDRSDAVTEAALRQFDHAAFDQHGIFLADNGSLGLTRNDGCRAASGNHILTADGDDLISFNTIERMFCAAERRGPAAILIPQFIFAFGATYHIAEYFDLDQVTPLALLATNPFVSRIFFHRSLCAHLAWQDVSLTNGYAYEDWHFNCNAVSEGYSFHAVPETILFYRQRAGSLLSQGNRVSVQQIPPSPMFQPVRYREICAPWMERPEAQGAFRSAVRCMGKAILDDPVCTELLIAANEIDPAINPRRLADSEYFNYLESDTATGAAYYRICELVGERQFDEVFLLPFMTAGGADRYILDVMTELAAQDPRRRFLIIFGEPCSQHMWLDRLPASSLCIDLIATCPELAAHQRELLCLKLIQSCAGTARLHLRAGAFEQNFFSRFAPVLSRHRPVFYRFADSRVFHGDYTLVAPWSFQFVADHVEQFDKFVCDSRAIVEADQTRIGVMQQKWHVLNSRMEVPDRLDEDALSAGRTSRSILWVSRLDAEKRPELLLEIARLVARSMPDMTIDVYGRPTLDEFDVTQFATLRNVRYHGFFERFEELQAAAHYCFLYTSRFDGIPVVLLEMMAAGLPVVAPDVGGIGEIVRDGDTGVLLTCSGDDQIDAEIYMTAIEALFEDPARRERICRTAFAAVHERHAARRYAERISAIFGSGPVTAETQVA